MSTERTLVLDTNIYHHVMDAQKAKDLGVGAVIARAVTGTYADVEFCNTVERCNRINLPAIGYGVYRQKVSVSAQYEAFKLALETGCAEFNRVMIDVEDIYPVNAPPEIIGPADLPRIKEYIDCVEDDIGVPPIIYTRKNIWDRFGTVAWAKNYPLNVAQYPWKKNVPWYDEMMDITRGGQPSGIPLGWSSWALWQWSETGPAHRYGVTGTASSTHPESVVDMNWFVGNKEELREFLAGGDAPPPPVVPPVESFAISLATMIVRTGPEASASTWTPRIAGVPTRLPQGTVVRVLQEVIDKDGNIWLQIGYKQWVARVYKGTVYMEPVANDG